MPFLSIMPIVLSLRDNAFLFRFESNALTCVLKCSPYIFFFFFLACNKLSAIVGLIFSTFFNPYFLGSLFMSFSYIYLYNITFLVFLLNFFQCFFNVFIESCIVLKTFVIILINKISCWFFIFIQREESIYDPPRFGIIL